MGVKAALTKKVLYQYNFELWNWNIFNNLNPNQATPYLLNLQNRQNLWDLNFMSYQYEYIVTIICRNDELSWLFANRLSATR